MPNYVKNIVHMEGIAREPLFTEADGRKNFDFDKLVPMPGSLDVESGSLTDQNIVYFLTERCTIPVSKLPPEKKALMDALVRNICAGSGWPEEVFRRVMAETFDETEPERLKRYDMGKIYVSNYELYGAATWYGWRIENWGTKWNACDTEIIGDDAISFCTAWSDPEPVLLKLAETYPDRKIEHWWADEDKGSNAGYRCLQGGAMFEDLHDQDDEALKLYARCWG